MRWARQVAGLVLAVELCACAGTAPPIPPRVQRAPVDDVELTLFLIGDGGEPKAGGEPVLEALSSEIDAVSGASVVVFLGDNIYPRGLPHPSAGNRAEMERRLKDQIDAVLRTRATGIFVPGNHDWDNSGSDGWNAIRRQEAFIRDHGDGGRVRQLPEGGCPGPSVLDLGSRLRLVAIDTQWWLHESEKPGPESCEPKTPGSEEGVVEALRSSLTTERHVIVVAHHPMRSSGPHGGYFNWQDHLFPLTRGWGPLWVPLPLIGSGYPLARKAGLSSQDMSGSRNERMRAALERAFDENPPLMVAAGHEHTLEVLAGETVPYFVVSGTGYHGHTSPTKWRDETLYQSATAGFVRLDVLRGGELRLGVLVVDAEARTVETFAIYLNAR